MTVNNKPTNPRLDNFYQRWSARNRLVFVVAQIIIVGLTTGIYFIISLGFDQSTIAFCVSLAAVMTLELVLGLAVIKKSIWPLIVISRKLNREVDLVDPNVEKTGLKDLIDAIDNLEIPAKITTDDNDKMAKDLLMSLPVGIIVLDQSRKIVTANQFAPISVGNSKPTIQLDFSNITESFDDWWSRVTANEIRSEKVWTRVQNVAPSSAMERRIFDVIAHYEKNSPTGIETIIITVDRTADYQSDEDHMDFVSLAAHELRTPITVIRGYLDALKKQMADKITMQEQASLDRITNAADNLSVYITNILNMSRFEHQELKLNLAEMSVGNIIDSIRDGVELNARILRRNLKFEIPDDLPTIAADALLVGEVLNNLIGNAVKYSPENGDILIKAKQISPQFVEFSIQDHGVGIPKSIMANLFNKFYRSHRSKSTNQGTGFGLYISRVIVKSHGGNIGVVSTEGKGSTFSFTLPIFATLDLDKSIQGQESLIQNHSRVVR